MQKPFFLIFWCISLHASATNDTNLAERITRQHGHLSYLLEKIRGHVAPKDISTQEQIELLHTLIEQAPCSQDGWQGSNKAEIAKSIEILTQISINLSSGAQKKFSDWQINLTRSEKNDTKSNLELTDEIKKLEKEITTLDKRIRLYHLSTVQQCYRTICKRLSRNNITRENAQKALAFAGLATFAYTAYYFFGRDVSGKLNPPKWLYAVSAILVGQVFKNSFIRTYHWGTHQVLNLHHRLQGDTALSDLIKTYPENGFEKNCGNTHNKKIAKQLIAFFENHMCGIDRQVPQPYPLLLCGPAHTGKTFFAMCLCGEINNRLNVKSLKLCPLITADASTITNLPGWDPGLKGFFDYALDQAPSILFINKLDYLLSQDKELLAQLLAGLNLLKYYASEKPVLVIAASDSPKALDNIALCQNRFGTKLFFEFPHVAERAHSLRENLGSISPLTDKEIHELAQATSGCSYHELTTLTNAIKRDEMLNKKLITPKRIEENVNTIIRKIKIPEHAIPPKMLQISAIHHASLLVALKKLCPEILITYATINLVEIDEHTQVGAIFICPPENTHQLDTYYRETRCKELLSGHTGEELFFGTSAHAYSDETNAAFELCKQIVDNGICLQKLPKKNQSTYIQRALNLLDTYKQEMRALLEPEKKLISQIAQELEQKKTLTQQEIGELLKHI